MDRIRLGISSCLLGELVRYDGEHKANPFLRNTLAQYVEYVGICPEVECGLPVPREPIQLEGDPAEPRIMTVQTRRDLTDLFNRWIDRRLEQLAPLDLAGYIFKARSPSCGLLDVPVHDPQGQVLGRVAGFFARRFTAHFPGAIAAEDELFEDPGARDRFARQLLGRVPW